MNDLEGFTAMANAPESPLQHIEIFASGMTLHGRLRTPDCPLGMVIFVNGALDRAPKQLSRLARTLSNRGMATLLLGPSDGHVIRQTETVFDVDFLARRASVASQWAMSDPDTADLPLAICGSGMGAAAAFQVAAELGTRMTAIVSIDGRPDLAAPALSRVRVPVLLLVREHQRILLELNQGARNRLPCPSLLRSISGRDRRAGEVGDDSDLDRSVGDWLVRHAFQRLCCTSAGTSLRERRESSGRLLAVAPSTRPSRSNSAR